ncbi:MAG: hypothetical protein ACXW03_02620 [Methylobacter sp.]
MKFKTTLATLIMASGAHGGTVNYVCDFAKFATPEGVEVANPPLHLDFVYDSTKNAAYVLGNNGANKVTPIIGIGRISFIEITGEGTPQTTTILQNGIAVHSRHTPMPLDSDFMASQNYGSCKIR